MGAWQLHTRPGGPPSDQPSGLLALHQPPWAVHLAAQPVITVAGVNGSGKTLLLEAIMAAWRGQLEPSDVGPFGDDMTVGLEFALEPHEVQALETVASSSPWRDHMGRLPPGTCPNLIPVEFTFRPDQHTSRHPEQAEVWARLLLRPIDPTGDMSFRTVDHLPANRAASRGVVEMRAS